MVTDAGTKVITAVREILTSISMPGEGRGPTSTTTPGNVKAFATVGELTQNPDGMTQYQSLALLAAIVRWFSRESGRSEEEILEGMAANYRR